MNQPLRVKPLTQADFAPFGDVIESEGRDSVPMNNGMAERFQQLARIAITDDHSYAAISLVKSKKFNLPHKVDHIEYHPFGSQAFIPLDQTPFIVVVAKAGAAPAADALKAFITNGRQGINYHTGTWHHVLLTPYAAMDFICVDRVGEGKNCTNHYFDKTQQYELLSYHPRDSRILS